MKATGATGAIGPNLPGTPSIDLVPLTGLCRLRDFAPLAPWLDLVVPFAREAFGAAYPAGVEYRKHWEVAQAVRALGIGGALRPEAEILGIGAGNEPTIFCLTNFVKRVFATDLYLADGWDESANASMLTRPGTTWHGTWNPRRLIVQHMDALDLQYEDDTFDGAFSSSSLEHFGDYDAIERSMREAFRVLKPGGVYAVSTEFRIVGPPTGLPGILMFDRDELLDHVIRAAPWEILGPDRALADERDADPTVSFALAAATVRAHIEQHGEIVWDQLHWPEYPHVRLQEGPYVWTSVHLALRKPGLVADASGAPLLKAGG